MAQHGGDRDALVGFGQFAQTLQPASRSSKMKLSGLFREMIGVKHA